MPRAVSKLDLYNSPKQEAITIYNRYVERINKQIQRLKKVPKSKLDYTKVIQAKDLVPMRKISRKTKYSTSDILRKYQKALEKPTYTQKAVKEKLKEKAELEKILGGRKISAKQFEGFAKLTKRATSESATYYTLLRTMHDNKLIDDWHLPEEWEKLSTDEVEDKMLEAINQQIDDRNKQRRTRGETELAHLTMDEIEKETWSWEVEEGPARIAGWTSLTPKEIEELTKLFPD